MTETRVELFEEEGGKTRLELTDGPYPAGFTHAEHGWTQFFDKLAAT